MMFPAARFLPAFLAALSVTARGSEMRAGAFHMIGRKIDFATVLDMMRAESAALSANDARSGTPAFAEISTGRMHALKVTLEKFLSLLPLGRRYYNSTEYRNLRRQPAARITEVIADMTLSGTDS